MTSEVQLKISADVGSAQREVGKFRQEYAKLVGDLTRPLQKIETFKGIETSLRSTEQSMDSARETVRKLADELIRTEKPSRDLRDSYRDATNELRKLERAQKRQNNQLTQARTELGAMGVQTRSLTAEQARLQAQLNTTMQAGRADAALKDASDRLGLTRVRELRASLTSLDADYRRVTQSARMSATERAAVEMQYQARLRETRRELNDMTGEFGTLAGEASGGTAVLMSRAAGLAAVIYSLKRVSDSYFDINDDLKNIEARLWNATNGQEEYNYALGRLKGMAKVTFKPLAEQMELFIATVGPLKEVGFTTNEVLNTVEALTLGLVASGTPTDQATAMMNQFSKAMQLGTLRGEAFNSFMENNRVAAEALQLGLGVSRAELLKMAAAGELTADKVLPALASQIDFLTQKVEAMPNEMRDADTRMKDGFRNLVHSFDKLTGFSDKATARLLKFADAVDSLGNADFSFFQKAINFNREVFQGIEDGSSHYAAGWLNSYVQWMLDLVDAQEDAVDESKKLTEEARQQADELAVAARNSRAADIKSLEADLKTKLDLTKDFIREQSRLESKANSEVEKVRNKRLEIEDRYQKALAGLTGGGKPSYGAAQSLMVGARQALAAKDHKEAQRQAAAALKMLQDLAAAGENTYGFAGFIKQLQGIELAANDLEQSEADEKLKSIKDEVKSLKEQVKDLEKIKIGFAMDDAALADVREKLASLGEAIEIKVPADGDKENLINTPAKATAEDVHATLRRVRDSVANSPIEVELQPKGWYREGNSFSDKPFGVEVEPKGWYQEGNSFSDKPFGVEVEPKGWYRDGNSFSDIPPVETDAEIQLDETAAAKTQSAVELFAAELQKSLELEVRPQWYPVKSLTSPPESAPGFSRGGWTGPGGKYQVAGVVHADEYVQPKHRMREPGALEFMERFRRYGMRALQGYAEGGLVSGIARRIPHIPSMPAMAPAAAGGTPVHLHMDGQSYEMQASQSVVDQLAKAVRRQKLRRG